MASEKSVNAEMKMSAAARTRLRSTEKVILHYYNDLGKNKGNCTWGAGILAHRGVCSAEEMAAKVSAPELGRVFDRKVAEAESAVRRNVTRVALRQDQFDALVSLVYNTGAQGAHDTFLYVDRGDFEGAANNIETLIRVRIRKAGKMVKVVAPGLIKRRAEESAPFRAGAAQKEEQ